jgi:hypothetical protein
MPSGETVRVRTSNERNLIAEADQPSAYARLNIQGTDWLLIVMPEIARTQGKIFAYLIPAEEAVADVRQAYQAWLANANTEGNTAWVVRFDHGGFGGCSNYAERWPSTGLKATSQPSIFQASCPTRKPAISRKKLRQLGIVQRDCATVGKGSLSTLVTTAPTSPALSI